jgi:hypothetical protein
MTRNWREHFARIIRVTSRRLREKRKGKLFKCIAYIESVQLTLVSEDART